MRWRSATEDVAAVATAPLNESLGSSAAVEDDTTTTAQAACAVEDSRSSTDSSATVSSTTNSNSKKRALEGHKQASNRKTETEPPDYVDPWDTITADNSIADADSNHTTAPLSNHRMGSNGNSSSSNAAQQEFHDDDNDDDDGGDHAQDDLTPKMQWKPQNVTSTCEFTHTILDYAQKRESGCKKAEYSAITQDELGNRWRLIVYVNGNGRASNHHLSLFLQVADADDLPFGWKKSVSYVLTLEHPNNSTASYAKRNPDKMFKLCPKAIDWGWSQFITSDRIQQEGFVKADTLTVRAQVTVKTSSVTIDEEDSELYLKCAVEEGDAESVKLCLQQGAGVNCQFKDDLYTPLHTACSSGTNTGSMQVLQHLLETGADGNACNKWKETPLLIAANNGHRAAVEALLKHGANPSLCSEAGWSALTFAAHKGYDDIVSLLLRAGAPVNCPVTEDSSTPLHKACAGSKPGHFAAVKLLLGGGADVHALNKWRETPLLTAANHGQAGAVEALLSGDADPCKCTDTGWSPLSIAAYKGHDEVVRLLLEDGAPTEEDDPTLSALLQAATKGLPDTVELLLRHGADHTVTTKKGDTALSILVEQNLIDAAAEMVSEYNASIPRCSRDRKKVQRARLLINLRMKQMEKEDANVTTDEDDDTDGDDDDSSKVNVAQHLENGSLDSAPKAGKKKTKKGKLKASQVEKARAAEEALLLELAQEDAQAKKEEAKANSKQAKKKKKKERERQLKMKEEEQRRKQEEKESTERERIRKENDEKSRKEREKRLKSERAREMNEMKEREKMMATKRKEREEREKRELAQKPQRDSGSVSPTGSRSSLSVSNKQPKAPNPRKAVTDPTPNRRIVSPSASGRPAVPLAGNRRWETTAKGKTSSPSIARQPIAEAPARPEPMRKIPQPTLATPDKKGSPATSTPSLSRAASDGASASQSPPEGLKEAQAAHKELPSGPAVEHPAITLFRRDKVVELIQRCTQSLQLVNELTLKRVLYRWIVRASHGNTPYSDPIIPSWDDSDQLAAYFQRQFIAESRRGRGASSGGPSMESLKETGSSVALFCQNLAKQVVDFRQRIDEQLPPDWTDTALGMTASDGTLSTSDSNVTVAWANRAQTIIPSLTFATLRERHVGPPTRFLAAAFVAKIWHDTAQLLVADTTMDLRMSPSTQISLSTEAGVSAELWSDPFSALNSNVFWGRFEQVDSLFGGQKPFGKDEHGSEEVLSRHGGSVSAFVPLDPMVASQYVQRMVDILDTANAANVPVSFAVFLNADSFLDPPTVPSVTDLHSLDSRLREHQSGYISYFGGLQPGQHNFVSGDGDGRPRTCATGSAFVVLQNGPGKNRYTLGDGSAARVIASVSSVAASPQIDNTVSSIGLGANDFPIRESPLAPHAGYFDAVDPISPDPQRVVRSDFGAIGGNSIPNAFSPVSDINRASRRGRLFDLVDDVDEEHLNDDIMSGMLNNLDVGLFQNANVGSDNIDIEAISLMGIHGPSSRSLGNPAGNAHTTGRLG